jgi:hypothetical protein
VQGNVRDFLVDTANRVARVYDPVTNMVIRKKRILAVPSIALLQHNTVRNFVSTITFERITERITHYLQWRNIATP